MASFTIRSRNHGEVRFVCASDGGYIRMYGNGWDGQQPCEGGSTMGVTLMADEYTLEATARRWWRQYLAAVREFA